MSGLSLSSVVTYICVSASHVIVEFRRGRGGGFGDSSRCKHRHHLLLFCDNFIRCKCYNLLVRLRGVEVLLGGGRGVVRLQRAVRRHAVSPLPAPGDSTTLVLHPKVPNILVRPTVELRYSGSDWESTKCECWLYHFFVRSDSRFR